ncbi:MAG: hypothetical protein M9932_11970 [Xanthobacteraceae bacterium]|nr:hypothetical protein [Xanthobacteraceae bacterium]
MQTKSAIMVVPALVAVTILVSGDAVAKPVRTTTISGQSAEAFCHGHGGGTDCIFCHRDHCHVINCSVGSGGKKFCTNTVSFRKANGQRGHGPTAGTASSGATAPPRGRRPPVRFSGFQPPSGVRTMGGRETPVIEHVEAHHFGGGHR